MPRPATELPPALAAVLTLDRAAAAPLAAQVADALRDAMGGGVLRPGDRLPASRTLAASLGVSRGVITAAFQQLYAEGWLDGRHGSGTYVADAPATVPPPPHPRPHRATPAPHPTASLPTPGPPPAPAPARTPPNASVHRITRSDARAQRLVDLRAGAPWTPGVDPAVWRRAMRRAADAPLEDGPDPFGVPALRALVAEHLRRVRGMTVGPEHVLITRGTAHGLDLIAQLALPTPPSAPLRAGVEDPGYRVARNVLAARGAQVVPCAVDWDGVRVEALPDDLALLYTTPAHQWPLGGRLPVPRRRSLLAWARATGALLIEDDYDAEFRYDVAPLPALFGLDPERVVLLGTLSKTLAPDVGVGWLVARPETVRQLARLRYDTGDRVPGPGQHAVAALLASGDLDRHLRRMRLEYARRRALVVELLGPHLTGDTAGLHVMLPLPADRAAALVTAAAAHGILLEDTSRHSHGTPPVTGVILGYGSATATDLRRACRTLAALLGDAPQAAN